MLDDENKIRVVQKINSPDDRKKFVVGQVLFENGKGSVVDEYGRSESMYYIVDEDQFRLEILSSHTQHLAQPASGERERNRDNADGTGGKV